MFEYNDQAITHIRGCCGDSNQWSALQGYKPDSKIHIGQKGTTSGYSSLHDQRVRSGPTSP
jgi:hypothetical protein